MEHIIDHGDYMPHGMCLLWEPWLLILWAGSDLLIFASYTAIPIALLTVLRKREDIPHGGLISLFASFILLCGLTHLFGVITLWYPIYPLVGWVKLTTGLISMATAVVLFRLIPTLINFPSPRSMQEANLQLQNEIAAHEKTLSLLEERVKERTKELERTTETLAVQTREAVHRSGNLLSVVISLATQTAKTKPRTEDFLPVFTARLRALSNATRSIERKGESSIALETVFDENLGHLEQTYGDRFTYAGPPVIINPEAAQQISLALHELATNAQKYALSASDTAHIEVNWVANDGVFELTWREYGSSALEKDQQLGAEGFGTKLLTKVIPTMLRGNASRSYVNGELVYKLSAPLEAVLTGQNHGDSDRLAARIVDESFGI